VNDAAYAPGPFWVCDRGEGPLVATAIHQGHELRPEIRTLIALDDADRFREEDPLTGVWTHVAGTKIRVLRSRFEVDLNRPREKAMPIEPTDAWGLAIWTRTPSADVIARSKALHDEFYRFLEGLMNDLVRRHGRVLVLDIHSYNYRRGGPGVPEGDPAGNPEVNVGTGTLDRARWAALIDRFVDALASFDFEGRHLDVRENVKFQGGYFPHWLHERFPASVCALSLEFKKLFMDEWTCQADIAHLEAIRVALQSAVRETLAELGVRP
jgi:N-formylglutamate amidohydrolase